MINDLDETLKQFLVQKAGLEPAEVDISFDIPTRDWSTPVTRPTVNLYLYDLRENRQLRETYWDDEPGETGRINLKRRPLRIDLSYMITCWTSGTEDQHRLLWRVMEAFFRYSPLPEDVLQGDLRSLIHPVRTEVAQPDGVLKNVSDFWGALENQLRPSVALVVTLDLDLEQIETHPLVLARALKFGPPLVQRDSHGVEVILPQLETGWEAGPVRLGGEVRNKKGQALPGAAVRLVGKEASGQPVQVGPTIQTDEAGRYIFASVPAGEYTLVVEMPGQAPVQRPLKVVVGERRPASGAGGQPMPELAFPVEVPM
jgi:hypothetical protein